MIAAHFLESPWKADLVVCALFYASAHIRPQISTGTIYVIRRCMESDFALRDTGRTSERESRTEETVMKVRYVFWGTETNQTVLTLIAIGIQFGILSEWTRGVWR